MFSCMNAVILFIIIFVMMEITHDPFALSFRFPRSLVLAQHSRLRSMAKSRSGTAIENNRKLRPWKPKPQTLNKTPPSSHVFSPSSSVKSVASHRSPQSPANSQRHIPFDNIAASAHFDTYFNQSRSIPYSKRFNRIPIGEIKVGKAYTGTVRNLIE
jgi:hypothetical protein